MSRTAIPRSRHSPPSRYSRSLRGPTGLDALAAIIAAAPRHLTRGGWLLLEHGSTQEREVARCSNAAASPALNVTRDYSGLPRVTRGTFLTATQGTLMIRFETTLGHFTVELYEKEAPVTVAETS